MNNTNAIEAMVPILPIGAMARALSVHQRTLRIYDKAGILRPKRTDKNRRYYSLQDLEKAKIILFLTRNLALNIAGVKIILALLEDCKMNLKESLEYIKKLADIANISSEIQEDNIEKASKKGRKIKNV